MTPASIYYQRREFIRRATAAGLVASSAAGSAVASACDPALVDSSPDVHGEETSYKDITHYNNYYEFSTSKDAVAVLAQALTTDPWPVVVDGEVEHPRTLTISDMLKAWPTRQRTYRFRCVEGWSMVIPWNGFQLCDLLKQVRPTNEAKYVVFTSLLRPAEMIGQRGNTSSLPWPYTESLRLDEAMHPLTLLATGLYDKPLPKQNGAPLRLVVPWKYGFKSIKAITRITLVNERPVTSWMQASPSEYGFYANVNPRVSHPRWSQSREVRIGELKKRRTLMFNGYEDAVANLYSDMDLAVNF